MISNVDVMTKGIIHWGFCAYAVVFVMYRAPTRKWGGGGYDQTVLCAQIMEDAQGDSSAWDIIWEWKFDG